MGYAAMAAGAAKVLGGQAKSKKETAAKQAQRDKQNQAAAHNLTETQQQLDAQGDINRQKDIQAQLNNQQSADQAAASSLVQAGATGTGGGSVQKQQTAADRQGDANASAQALNYQGQMQSLQSKQNQAANQFNSRYNPEKLESKSMLSSMIEGAGAFASMGSMMGDFGGKKK